MELSSALSHHHRRTQRRRGGGAMVTSPTFEKCKQSVTSFGSLLLLMLLAALLLFEMHRLLLPQRGTVPSRWGALAAATSSSSSSSSSTSPPLPYQKLSWITGSRLTHSQLHTLGLREGTECPEESYHRVVSLHDGPGPQIVTVGRVTAPHDAVIMFGVPFAYQSTFGKLSKRGDKIVIDAFAADMYISVQRDGDKVVVNSTTRTTGTTNTSSNASTTTTKPVLRNNIVYHHLSKIEITCRSPIYRLSCEARYYFMKPSSRLLEPTLVMIHPLESRTTLPLNGISAIIASALTSTASVALGSRVFDDIVNIEYLSFVVPTLAYPCPRTEHWLRTIPAYIESAVLAGLIAAVGGDTTTRGGSTPVAIAGKHLQVKKGATTVSPMNIFEESSFAAAATTSPAAATASTTTVVVAQPTPAITTFTAKAIDNGLVSNNSVMLRHRITRSYRQSVSHDANTFTSIFPRTTANLLAGATYLLIVMIVIVVASILFMFVSRKTYVSIFRDVWVTPDGRRMIFGNAPAGGGGVGSGGSGAAANGNGGRDGDGSSDEDDSDSDEGDDDDESDG